MSSVDCGFIELRLEYPGHPYVAVIGSLDGRLGFERIFDPFYQRRELLPDGRWEQVHRLPCMDLVYEVEEVCEGKRIRRYIATLEGDTAIFPVTRAGVKAVAGGKVSIRDLIRKLTVSAGDEDE